MKKKIICTLLTLTLTAASLTACGGSKNQDPDKTLTVLNYGKYFDEEALKQFEEETGITVKYEEYESPEEMYTKYKAGGIDYDVICSSEYMVEKLIQEGEVLEMDYAGLSNYKNLDSALIDMTVSYDPDHKFSLPYFYGTLGLLYDTTKVSAQEISSWNCLWDTKYKNELIMMNSVRDTFTPALRSLGYSLNDTDEEHLREALAILKKQRADGLVYANYVDETSDAMIGEEATIALCYSGEAALAMEENENLSYKVPKEGSNLWIDSWFVPKTCRNQEAVTQFLDFVCREDIAQKNFEYVMYSSPVTSVIESQSEELLQNEAINPSPESVANCEIYLALSDEKAALYNALFQELLAD